MTHPLDIEYWNRAAKDPEVDVKYISDVDTEKCLLAILPHIQGPSILEIGSGVGRLSIPILQRYKDAVVFGVDISEKMMSIAHARAIEAGVLGRFRMLTPELAKTALTPSSIDSAFSMLTFQHIDRTDLYDYLALVHIVLKPGGAFRFQFVTGDYSAPQHHQYSVNDITVKLATLGFDIKQIAGGAVHPDWTWVTAVKASK